VKAPAVAAFCMGDRGHFQRLRSVFQGLARRGVRTHVFTDKRFRPEVEAAGAVFEDLFAFGGVDAADDASWPVPVRYVSFAGHLAEAVAKRAAQTGAGLVLHDTFAVIGASVASVLSLPRVNVCSGHNVAPAKFVPFLEQHPKVRVSEACRRAVARLGGEFGLHDASPFSYVSAFSPSLNVYGEPPEFLEPDARAPFEPIAFYGSLPEPDEVPPPAATPYFPDARPGDLKVYASFGTVIWGVRRMEGVRGLASLAAALSREPGLSALISLGGMDLDADERRRIAAPGVRVEDYVNQWGVLSQADAFVTHAGLNSVHEAIYRRVPMIAYPFGWDQPDEARLLRKFGLAVPLGSAPMAEFGDAEVKDALERFREARASMRENLEQARGWELRVIAERPAVLDRVLAVGR
jgi:UDP:flavonoid glycosyltransferase YjiC (YdhE family)